MSARQGTMALGEGRGGPPEVEGLTRAKAHSRHSPGTFPQLGDDHMLCPPPSRAAAVPALLPGASWCLGPAGAQVSGSYNFPVGCLGESQHLSS